MLNAAIGSKHGLGKFDHILCNPPYFDNGPQTQELRRANARHTNSLSFNELLQHIQTLLAEKGLASLVLPSESLDAFTKAMANTQLQLAQRVNVSTVSHKAPSRVLLCLRHESYAEEQRNSGELPAHAAELLQQHMHIQDKNGLYSQQMQQICRDFYLKL
ncbi:hypothetical protein [Shewanella maritima]|uniref:hypothetical protein n=1 Tax=Shewanella maritima TaxID=2520507 RepID=UPI0026AEF5C8